MSSYVLMGVRVYHVLTIIAAVVSGWSSSCVWPAFVLAAATALVMRSDLDTKWGLSSLMPKGPSQNVIGRRSPKALRGERPRKVVLLLTTTPLGPRWPSRRAWSGASRSRSAS